jgi:hypothetical protein
LFAGALANTGEFSSFEDKEAPMTSFTRAVVRPLALALPVLLVWQALALAAPPVQPPPEAPATGSSHVYMKRETARISGAGGALAPVASENDKAACTREGKTLVTIDGKTYCGAPLDAAGEAACLKAGGKIVVIGTGKWCETPKPAAPASTKPPGS